MFSRYCTYMAPHYLYVFQKTMDVFDASFYDSTFCNIPGSEIYDLLTHILSFYSSVDSGGENRYILLMCNNTLVHYFFSSFRLEVIKPEEYRVNNELTCNKIPNEIQERIKAQYLWEYKSLMASLGPIYHQVNTIQSIYIPNYIMYQCTCTFGCF